MKEVIDIVRCLKTRTSGGYDDINITVVNKIIHLICVPLCSIINSCLSTGIFPNQMKIAKVIPVFKSGNLPNVQNDGPYSLKTSCNILFANQHGFRMGHSTTTALLNFIDKVSHAIDSKQFTIALFLELSKPFDTLDHAILLRKLEAYSWNSVAIT